MRGLLLAVALACTGCDFQSAFRTCVDAGWCADEADGGVVDAGSDAGSSAFSCASGWCWDTPTPRVTLRAVLSVSPREAWAFGDYGTALRFDGTTWTAIAGRSESLTSAVSLGPGLVLVGSDRGLFAFDGGAWTQLGSFTTQIEALGRDPSGELFATASSGWFRSLNGTTWTPITYRCDARDFTFPAPGKGWASCADGRIFTRVSDGGWEAQVTPTLVTVSSVWATSPQEAWAAGELGTLLHFSEDAGWEALDAGAGDSNVYGDSVGPGDTWIASNGVGLVHWTAAGVQPPVQLELAIEAIDVGGDAGWVVGDHGTLGRLEGETWSDWPVGSLSWVFALHGTAPDDVWAARTAGLVEHHDGVAWTARPIPVSVGLRALFAHTRTDVWVVGQSGATFNWDGTRWTQVDVAYSGDLNGVWVGADGVAWIVGSQGVFRRATAAGAETVPQPVTTDLSDIWGVGQDLWVSAFNGEVVHCTQSQDAGCELMTPPDAGELTSIYASAPDDLWVTSVSGTVHQWNGSSWRQRRVAGAPVLNSVRGDGTPFGVYVVGNEGFVQRFGRDGGITPLSVGTTEQIFSSFSTDDGGLTWVSGSWGSLLRRGR